MNDASKSLINVKHNTIVYIIIFLTNFVKLHVQYMV